jgi:hypothetical protein
MLIYMKTSDLTVFIQEDFHLSYVFDLVEKPEAVNTLEL